MRNPIAKKITQVRPSGIRKFFDIASEMDDVFYNTANKIYFK